MELTWIRVSSQTAARATALGVVRHEDFLAFSVLAFAMFLY